MSADETLDKMLAEDPAVRLTEGIATVLGMGLLLLIPLLLVFAWITARRTELLLWKLATALLAGLTLVVLSLGAWQWARQSGANEVAAEMKTVFVSADKRVSISGPKRWEPLDLGADGSSLEIGSLASEEYLVVITEPKSDFEPDFSLIDYGDVVTELMADRLVNTSRSEPLELEIDGLAAHQIELQGNLDELTIVYLNFFIESENAFHQILSWTLEPRRDAAFPEFFEAAESFRLARRGAPISDSE
ncbi:MAG: hypothetical protein AAF236_09500 [Verrucomicrobiota bacterium]